MLEMKGECWHRAKEELVKAGMEREFVGRLPVRVALQALSDEDLFQVLTPLSCSQSFTCVCCGCCSQSRYRIRESRTSTVLVPGQQKMGQLGGSEASSPFAFATSCDCSASCSAYQQSNEIQRKSPTGNVPTHGRLPALRN